MSAFAEKIKGYYDLGLWDEIRVKNAVQKGAITSEEYAAITGEAYLD